MNSPEDDDLEFEAFLIESLGSSVKLSEQKGVFEIIVPRHLRGIKVSSYYPKATCRRSIAVATKPEDVEYINIRLRTEQETVVELLL